MIGVKLTIAESPAVAPHYARDEIDTRACTLTEVVIVKKGTVNGKSTIDLVLVDQQGGKMVAMTSAALLAEISRIVELVNKE